MKLADRYKAEINAFFEGTLPQSVRDMVKGHMWICEHGHFDTLTVEPPREVGGGQYEIAVRFAIPEGYDIQGHDKYSGYIAYDDFFHGRNVAGH